MWIPLWRLEKSLEAYKVSDVGFTGNIFYDHLSEESALLIGEDELIIGNYVYEMGTHIQGRLEQVWMRFEVLVFAAIVGIICVIACYFLHFNIW